MRALIAAVLLVSLTGCAAKRPVSGPNPAKALCVVQGVDPQGKPTIMLCKWGDGRVDSWNKK